jgi:hypothetical protein
MTILPDSMAIICLFTCYLGPFLRMGFLDEA